MCANLSSVVLCFIEGRYKGPGIYYFTSFEMKCVRCVIEYEMNCETFLLIVSLYASSEMGFYTLLGC